MHSCRDEEPPAHDVGGNGDDSNALPGGLTDADIDSNWDEAIESFDAMDLPEELLRGIYAYGFEKPSAIQQRAIKPTILGRDLIAQAQSGTVRRPFTVDDVKFIGTATRRETAQGMRRTVIHHLSSLNRVTLDVSDNARILKIGPLLTRFRFLVFCVF